MLRTNRVRKALEQGYAVFGVTLGELTSVPLITILATAGYDWVCIDMEHGFLDLRQVLDLIQVTRHSGMTPFVRVPGIDRHAFAGVLDAGAEGVLVPLVETREQAEEAVSYTKYYPEGTRGMGYLTMSDYLPVDLAELSAHLNRETMVWLIIETPKAVENLEEILSVPGVDGIIPGAYDLAVLMGLPLDHPKVEEQIDRVIRICRERNVHVGGAALTPEGVHSLWEEGLRLLACDHDTGLLSRITQEHVKEVRRLIGDGLWSER